jgi:hypothetical protein
MSIFTSKVPIVKTAEAKKITRIANRLSKTARERRKPGPVIVTVYKTAS